MNRNDLELKDRCEISLSYHLKETPRQVLTRLSNHPLAEQPADYFGNGAAIQQLESDAAKHLGKTTAVYFQKGVTAQQCMLRAYSESRSSPYVALSPMGHIDFEEGNASEIIHGLRPIRLGRHAPFKVADLANVRERLAAVVVETPIRRAGYVMNTWDELVLISNWCRQEGVPFHLDGARIWEAAAGMGRDPRELAELADTVYASFYKGLGGLAGCVLAGDDKLVRLAQPWRARLGGVISTAYPYVIAAIDGFERHLPRMPAYVHRARQLALRLQDVCATNLSVPHTNAFQVILDGIPSDLAARNREFASARRVWLFNSFSESQFPGKSTAEIVVGSAADRYTDDDAAAWLSSFCS
jgi:threonine aldolase